MLGVVGVVLLGVVCVRVQVTPWLLRSFVRMAKKGCFSFVGTAAVVGLSVTATPESIESGVDWKPFLLVSPTACTLMMMDNKGYVVGSGRTDGAVNVAVPVICSLVSVPNEPSVGQTLVAETVCVPEELVVVVV
jgi:hypothetical protein